MLNQMEPIFIETDKARNTTIQVPEAVSEWSDFLINELYKQHPSLSGKAADVHFQNTDEEQGYATGSIKISDNGRPLLNVPFIIEARRLYPLDVFFSNQMDNDPHPLTEDRIREVFFHARMMDGLAPPPRQGDLTNAGMYYGADETVSSHNFRVPPSSMGIDKWGEERREENNWYSKLAHCLQHQQVDDGLLKKALDLTVKEDIDDWKDEVLSESGALAIRRMEKNGTLGGIELIAEAPAPPRSFVKAAMELEDLSIKTARIRKDGPDQYTVWLAGDEPHELTKLSMPRREVRKIIETIEGAPADKDMMQLENNGERIFSAIRWHDPNDSLDLTEEPEGSPVYEEAGPVHRKVNVYDPIVRASMKGWLLGNVIYPSGKLTGNRLFINPENFAYQPNMAVEYLDGTIKDARIAQLNFSYPRAGEMGTFVSQDDVDAGTGMVPFKVLSVITDTSDADEGMAIRAETINGNRVILIPSPHTLTIRPIGRIEARRHLGTLGAPGEAAYLIPRRFQYVVLGAEKKVAKNKEETVKTAADTGLQIEVIHDDGLFHLRGGPIASMPLEKWGYLKHSMNEMEAFHTLVNAEVPGREAAEAIKQAACGKKHIVKPKRKPYAPLKKKPTVKEAMMHHALLEKELRGLRNRIRSYPLLKIASGIPDVATVNNVLSLRFVGPETFHHFASNIPLLEKTLSFLSTLLLSSRIESTMDLDEQEISTAIRLVDNTLQRIKKMKAIVAPT